MSEEDVFKLLGDRLALSRLKKLQQTISVQNQLDNSIRLTKYNGYNVNQGVLLESGNGVRTAKAISNGLIVPGQSVRSINDTADWMPRIIPEKKPKLPEIYFGIVASPKNTGAANICRIAFCEAKNVNTLKAFETDFKLFLPGAIRIDPLFSYDSIFNSQFWFTNSYGKYLEGIEVKKVQLSASTKSAKTTDFNLPIKSLQYSGDYSLFELHDDRVTHTGLNAVYSKVIKYLDVEGKQRLCCLSGNTDNTGFGGIFIWDLGLANNPSIPKNVCCYFGMGFVRRFSAASMGGFYGAQVKGAYGANKGICIKLFVDELSVNFGKLDYEIFIHEKHLKGESGKCLNHEQIAFSSKINNYLFRWLGHYEIPRELCEEINGGFYLKKEYLKIVKPEDFPTPLDTREPYLIKSYETDSRLDYIDNQFTRAFLTSKPKNLFYYVSASDCKSKKFIFS